MDLNARVAIAADHFTVGEWLEVCETAAQEAAHGCGGSDVLCIRRCTALIQKLVRSLPLEHQKHALNIAFENGYYFTDDQIAGVAGNCHVPCHGIRS